ncbi:MULTISPECIES: hypothetical protein [unclassified Brevibacillus]|uniref:hypothetical protein n=1 Tax=unclassified Brevibacillus TaxID=2684853 RepID=UPI0035620643
MASIDDVKTFLELCKKYKDANKLDFIMGKEEKYTLGKMGISMRDAFSMFDYLTYKNYYRGPNPDHNGSPGDVWEFGLEDDGTEIYIKLKIRTPPKDDLLFMSFHFPARPIVYPYKTA